MNRSIFSVKPKKCDMPVAVMKKYQELLPTLFEENYKGCSALVFFPLPEANNTFIKRLFENFGRVKSVTKILRSINPIVTAWIVAMHNRDDLEKAAAGLNGLKISKVLFEVSILADHEKARHIKKDREMREKQQEEKKKQKH